MKTYKVSYTGSTPQTGETFHDSEDLMEVGRDALDNGLVIEDTWIHPSRISSIQVVPEPVVVTPVPTTAPTLADLQTLAVPTTQPRYDDAGNLIPSSVNSVTVAGTIKTPAQDDGVPTITEPVFDSEGNPVMPVVMDGGFVPADGSEPTDETQTASSETVVPITNPDLTGVPGDDPENTEANPEPTQIAPQEQDPAEPNATDESTPIKPSTDVDPNAAIPVTVVSNPVMAVPSDTNR